LLLLLLPPPSLVLIDTPATSNERIKKLRSARSFFLPEAKAKGDGESHGLQAVEPDPK